MSELPSPSGAGRIIGGRYQLEALLGRGGMGVVYAAVHLHTRRKVAIKVVRHAAEADPRSRERLFVEARTAAAVRHDHIVDVLDMGADGDELFLVMELLEGRSLEAELRRRGRVSWGEALAWLLPIMDALGALHRAGVVHRDVKPGNIFLSAAGEKLVPKLLDFGLARGSGDGRITNSGLIMGTPLYMAPEHAAGAPVGPAADVWSLGVVLYECISGKAPFATSDWSALVTQVTLGRVQPLAAVCPDQPLPLLRAVDGALLRDLNQRHRSVADFAQVLLEAAAAAGVVVEASPAVRGHLDDDGRALRDRLTEPQPAPAPQAVQPANVAGARASSSPSAPELGLRASKRRYRQAFWVVLAMLLTSASLGAWRAGQQGRAAAPPDRTESAPAVLGEQVRTRAAPSRDPTVTTRRCQPEPSERTCAALPSPSAQEQGAAGRARRAGSQLPTPARAVGPSERAQDTDRRSRRDPARRQARSTSGVETEWL